MQAILTVVFLISLFGYYLAYGLFIKHHVSFFPLFYAAYAVIFLYIFGLAGILKAGFYVLLTIGILLIPFAIYKGKNEVIPFLRKTLTDPSLLYIAAGTIWVFVITKGVGISHCDDFSHWYKICKMMYFENAYPTKPDTFYTTYVPGTATWIWLITSVTGFAADRCLFAHSLLHLFALNTFFSLGDRKVKEENTLAVKALLFFLVSALSITLCSMNVNTYCLLTDTTIALVPMAAVFFVLSDNTGSFKMNTVLFTLLMCFEILIKVAGIPFVVFVCIYRNMQLKKTLSSSKHSGLSGIAVKYLPAVVPFAFFFAYIIRAKIVFGSIEQSSQGISLMRFAIMFFQKTDDQIKGILGRFVREMFDLFGVMSMQVRLLWLVFAVMTVLFIVTKKKKNAELALLKKTTSALFIFFVVYSFFLLMTYICSMENHEANADLLNCFYRYIGSVTIFVFGIISYILYVLFSKMDKHKELAANIAMAVISIVIGAGMFDIGYIAGFDHYHQIEIFTMNSWDLLNEYAPEQYEYNTDMYFVIYNNDDVIDFSLNKTKLASCVYFRSKNIIAFSIEDLRSGGFNEQNLRIIRNSDYLVTLGNFSDQLDVIGYYVDVENYTPGTTKLKE